MPDPNLARIDTVPMGSLVLLEQEQDRSSDCTTVFTLRSAPGLAIPAPFGVRV